MTPTLDERIETAARAFYEAPSLYGQERTPWDELPALMGRADIGDVQKDFRGAARFALTAAFPELLAGTHAVLPLEATPNMVYAGRGEMRRQGLLPTYTDESADGRPPIMTHMLQSAWPVMCAAYLASKDKPT
jgi:hypothetical protein